MRSPRAHAARTLHPDGAGALSFAWEFEDGGVVARA